MKLILALVIAITLGLGFMSAIPGGKAIDPAPAQTVSADHYCHIFPPPASDPIYGEHCWQWNYYEEQWYVCHALGVHNPWGSDPCRAAWVCTYPYYGGGRDYWFWAWHDTFVYYYGYEMGEWYWGPNGWFAWWWDPCWLNTGL